MSLFNKKSLVTTFFLTLSIANASPYLIKYKGVTLGEIENLDTLNKLYLNAKATNPIVRFLLRKKRYVFYAGEKPNITDAKFRRDKNQLLFALREAIKYHPKEKTFTITNDKKLMVSCKDKTCHYYYYKHGRIDDSGLIEFDNNNNFFKLTEKKANVVIVKKR